MHIFFLVFQKQLDEPDLETCFEYFTLRSILKRDDRGARRDTAKDLHLTHAM